MPHKVRGKLLAGDPRHGTRWADPFEKEIAARALADLATNFNRIVLAPAPDPRYDNHKIRVQESANPDWYREFLAGRWNRKGCQIRRSRIEKALRRVSVIGIVRSNGYEAKLLRTLQDHSGELMRTMA
jgi:hypothetical protein